MWGEGILITIIRYNIFNSNNAISYSTSFMQPLQKANMIWLFLLKKKAALFMLLREQQCKHLSNVIFQIFQIINLHNIIVFFMPFSFFISLLQKVMSPLCRKDEVALVSLWSFIGGQVQHITIKLGCTNGAIFSPHHAAMVHSKNMQWLQYYSHMLPRCVF